NDALRVRLKRALARDYEISLATNRQEALAMLRRSRPPVVALDLALASGAQAETEAFQTIAEILNEEATTRVIVMTTPENRVPAVKAIARGAYDYIAKPLQMEELKLALRRTFNLWEIEQQTRDY